jgi:cysteine-rich repeat protein
MHLRLGLAIPLLSILLASPSLATLEEIDLLAPGDGLVTRDSASGLDWLDVPQTAGLTYNQVLGGAGGWLTQGWRHATAQEICDLFEQYAIRPASCPSGATGPVSGDHTSQLIALLGATGGTGAPPCFACAQWTVGLYDDGGGPAIGQAFLEFIQPNLTPPTSASSVGNDQVGVSDPPPDPGVPDLSGRGHFLVRAEPPDCGNGVVEPPEECDDGGTAPQDGCDESCRVEDGFACAGNPSICMSSSCGGTDLIVNGSFEDPVYGLPASYPVPLTGWSSSEPGGFEVHNHYAGAPPSDGDQWIELDVYYNTTVHQDIETVPGRAYLVSFAFADRPNDGPLASAVRFYWGGALIATAQQPSRDIDSFGWDAFTFPVVATSASTRVAFEAAGESDGSGDWIDSVSVTESCQAAESVPVVGWKGLAMLALSLGVVGARAISARR